MSVESVLANLKAQLDAATPGEWRVTEDYDAGAAGSLTIMEGNTELIVAPCYAETCGPILNEADATLIASAHNALGALIDVAEAAAELLARNPDFDLYDEWACNDLAQKLDDLTTDRLPESEGGTDE